MQSSGNSRGAKHRLLILIYITCLTLSLAPAMVAPPEREFAQGQPEMQQSMDNMVSSKTIIKKRTTSSPNDGEDHPSELASETSNFLAEAEQLLYNLPNLKDKKWIEQFIQHLKSMATVLEKAADEKDSPDSSDSASGTPVPEVLPLQPTWPATSAVPGINTVQKQNKIMSKLPVTSPELSKVLQANDYPSERQAVTKPAVLPTKKEDVEEMDELVLELENLHQENVQQASPENSKVLDQASEVAKPSTLVPEKKSVDAKWTNAENEKEKLKTKLINEIAEFHRLGGEIPKEVVNALYTNKEKAADIPSNRNTNVEDAIKFTEAGMVDRQGFQRINDFSNEDKEISDASMQNIPHQAEEYHPLKFNHTFQYMHPNLPLNLQAFPKQMGNYLYYGSPQNKEHPYQGHVQNVAQDLQKSSIIQGKYHGMVAPPNRMLGGHIPEALEQMLSKPRTKFYDGHLTNAEYFNYLMMHGSLPYTHILNLKNSTIHHPSEMQVLPKQHMNHMIDTQLSDEMKRELRDGKIIVLSDSVVHSNFEPNKNDKTAESTTEKQNVEKIDRKREADLKI